jgi:hypothetical protein
VIDPWWVGLEKDQLDNRETNRRPLHQPSRATCAAFLLLPVVLAVVMYLWRW